MTLKKPRSQFKILKDCPGFTQDLANTICFKTSQGKSLITICKPKSMPSPATVYNWLRDNPVFDEEYMRAREQQAEYYASEIIRVSRMKSLDPQDKRVQVDALKWVASKLKPNTYGDRQTIRHEDAGDMAERLGSARDRADNVVDIKTVKNKA